MFAITRCDADNTDFYKTFAAIKEEVGAAICPVIVPHMENGKVASYVNLASRKAFDYSGGTKKEVDMPSDAQLDEMLDILTEAVASSDDELMEKFFAGETFTREGDNQGSQLRSQRRLRYPRIRLRGLHLRSYRYAP